MSEVIQGVFAFPFKEHIEGSYGQSDGMTMRDYFAARAMLGLMSGFEFGNEKLMQEISAQSYKMADAMLKAKRVER